MKAVLFLFLFFITSLMSFAAFAKEARDMSEPPFLMSSYDEFSDLQKEQKESYLKELAVTLTEVPALKITDATKLDEASEWYAGWNLIRKSVYDYCEENAASKTCEKLSDLRVKTLNNYALKPFDLDK
jgi:hypothetical protein